MIQNTSISVGFIKTSENIVAGDVVSLSNSGVWAKLSNLAGTGLHGVVQANAYVNKYRAGRAASILTIGFSRVNITQATQDYPVQGSIVTANISGLATINGSGVPIGYLTKPVNSGDTTAMAFIVTGIALAISVTLTDAQVKAKYLANADTNNFDDAAQLKLSGIETGATIDQIASEVPVSAITGLTATDVQSALEQLETQFQGVMGGSRYNGTYQPVGDTNIPTNQIESNIEAGDYWRVVDTDTPVTFNSTTIKSGDLIIASQDTPTVRADFYVINQDSGAAISALQALVNAMKAKLDTIETGAEVNDTAAEIKIKYESNADTNNFDDTRKAKLDDIPNVSSALNNTLLTIFTGGYGSTSIQDIVDMVNAKTAAIPVYNLNSLVDPTVSDDSDASYSKGSLWINTTDDNIFICIDATVDSAVWLMFNPDAVQIKTLYESNADTNNFSDTQRLKVNALPQFASNLADHFIRISATGYDAVTKEVISAELIALANLGDLRNVSEANVVDGQSLIYNKTNNNWVPGNPTAAATSFEALTDTDLSAKVDGDVPVWDSGVGKWKTKSGSGGFVDGKEVIFVVGDWSGSGTTFTYTANHDLGASKVNYAVFDANGPTEITSITETDNDNLLLTATSAFDGHVSVVAIGLVSESADTAAIALNTAHRMNDADPHDTIALIPDATSSVKGLATPVQITKLDGIEDGAEVNETASEIKTKYESNADTNDFDDAAKAKLSSVANGAQVNPGAATVKSLYESNDDTNDFDDAAVNKLASIAFGAGVTLNSGMVKTLYELNANTNAFTDSFRNKLNGIEDNATQDQTASEIKSLYESNDDTNDFDDDEKSKLAGIPADAEANPVAFLKSASVNTAGTILTLKDQSNTNILFTGGGGGGGSSQLLTTLKLNIDGASIAYENESEVTGDLDLTDVTCWFYAPATAVYTKLNNGLRITQ